MWIRIKTLKLFAHHGVFDFEKEGGGTYEFDIEVKIKSMLSEHDELSETLDYRLIIEAVKKVSGSHSYNLLEKLASDTAKAVLSISPRIEEAILRVRKMRLPLDADIEYIEAEARAAR
jgi:dihydroneopterin aldolase